LYLYRKLQVWVKKNGFFAPVISANNPFLCGRTAFVAGIYHRTGIHFKAEYPIKKRKPFCNKQA